jgi:hypothetical protein
MSRSKIGPLIPGVLYKMVSKPSYHPESGDRVPGGYNTLLVKFVRTDGENYVWTMMQYNMGEFVSVNYDANNTTEFAMPKEMVSKFYYVSEAERSGGKRKSRRNKSKKAKKSRKQIYV